MAPAMSTPDHARGGRWALTRRWRIVLVTGGGIAMAALLALAVAVYLLLQPQRFTALLQAQASGVGLELNLTRPASPTLFPRPALELRGITLSAQDANAPILLAARGQLVLPWRTLFGGPTVISQLAIDAPRVDLAALQDWLATLPTAPPGSGTRIPRIDAGVNISRGVLVRGDDLLLRNVAMQSGSFISGTPFVLTLSARTAGDTPLQMRLNAIPRVDAGTLELNDIAWHLAQQGKLSVVLNGSARWHGEGGTRLNLRGTLDHADRGQYAMTVQLAPARDAQPAALAVQLDGPDSHASLVVPTAATSDWWQALLRVDNPRLGLPPVNGRVDVAKLEVGGVHIEGLQVLTGAAVPTSAGSVATPAASDTKPRPKQQPEPQP